MIESLIILGLIVGPISLAGLYAWFERRRRRDQIWSGVTPGERPLRLDGGESTIGTRAVTAADHNIAVRFTPPDEMTPGMAGTIIDGSADRQDVAATIIDLAVRGYLVLHAEAPAVAGSASAGKQPSIRWRLVRTDADPRPLENHEINLLSRIGISDEGVFVDQLPPAAMSTTRDLLRQDAVRHGWLGGKPTLSRVLGGALIALGGILTVSTLWAVSSSTLAAGIGALGAGVILWFGPRGTFARTPEGTAVRIQAVGFQRYLATAEARQIKLEEAQDIFSRFLPWAIAFGVADRWAKTFAEAAELGHANGIDVAFDLAWIDGLNLLAYAGDIGEGVGAGVEVMSVLAAADPSSVLHSIDGLTTSLSEATGLLTEGLGGIAEGVGRIGDFIGDIDVDFDF